MKDQSENLEIKGRLWLWMNAISECQSILRLVKRTQAELDTGRPNEIEISSNENFKDFLRQQPDYKPGHLLLSHIIAFDKSNPKEFPCFTDCLSIKYYLKMLSVIIFCQIINKGNSDKGNTAGNTKNFISTHLSEIENRIFLIQEDKNRFKYFKEQCKKSRDQMLGHADGSAFEVKHGPQVSSMKIIQSSIKEIDFEYMNSILEPLRVAILEYANEVST